MIITDPANLSSAGSPAVLLPDPRWEEYDKLVHEIVVGPTPLPDTSGYGPKVITYVFKPDDGVASASDLNRVSTSAEERQLTLAADGAAIRLTYGRDRIGAQILNVLSIPQYVVVQCLWGFALEEIESVTLNDKELPFGTVQTDYTGSQVVVDSTMESAFAAQTPSIDYDDTLTGFAYTVLKIRKDAFDGSLNISAIVKGRKVYDPRDIGQDPDDDSTWLYSDNPSLCLADFLADSTYGCGKTVDWTSVDAAADWNDTVLEGTEKQRLIGWTLTDPQSIESVVEALRTYASVWVVRQGDTFYLVPDKTGSSVATYAHTSGDIVSFGAAEKRDLKDIPSRVEILYTDTSEEPWRDKSAIAIMAGETERRLSTVRLNGVQRYSQAYREAVERLNKLALNDLSIDIVVFDKGIQHEIGDVITLSLPIGLSSKLMRVVGVEPSDKGTWALSLVEYDPAVYSAEVQTTPTYPDTDLPTPDNPPTVSSITASEELVQNNDGIWSVRGRLTWSHDAYEYVEQYEIEVYDGVTLVHAGRSTQAEYATPPLQDETTYSVRVRIVTTIGVLGEWGTQSMTLNAKSTPPTNVSSISGFEVGGDIYLSWSPAADIDIWRYELRYGVTTETNWDNATLLDRVDALRYVSKGVLPNGTWRIYVKAVDSGRNYSASPATCDITVTVNPDALQTTHTDWGVGVSTYAPVDMAPTFYGIGNDTWYVTEHGVAMSTVFNAAGMSGYTNALLSYQADSTNTWYSDEWDAGVDLTGDWDVDIEVIDVSGTATVSLLLSDYASYPTYTNHTTLPAKTTARYARIKVTGTGEFKIRRGSEVVTCYAVTRKEYGLLSNCAASANTITLDAGYFKYRSIVLTPVETSSFANCVVDNITLDPDGDPANTFDIWVFDAAGTALSGVDVAWKFEGV